MTSGKVPTSIRITLMNYIVTDNPEWLPFHFRSPPLGESHYRPDLVLLLTTTLFPHYRISIFKDCWCALSVLSTSLQEKTDKVAFFLLRRGKS